MNEFFNDVWSGLKATPKRLQSKYFYDEEGDKIFQQIMDCPEYYLTRSELEIFSQKTNALSDAVTNNLADFDLVELGPGDCLKSIYLLRSLLQRHQQFTYFPIDFSKNVINQLSKRLPAELPGLKMQALNGDYFDMLEKVKTLSNKKKVVLFLGSSIGNIPFENTVDFLKNLRSHLMPGDVVLIGFDLKKDAATTLAAYNDKGGFTRDFNLNLLKRINRELDADINIEQFEHTPEYNAETGACKSYLKSLTDQRVRIGEEGWVYFAKDEKIFMEISQKYTVQQTDEFAQASGFKPLHHFYDAKEWFLDALWECV